MFSDLEKFLFRTLKNLAPGQNGLDGHKCHLYNDGIQLNLQGRHENVLDKLT